jgi:hypothetical protein
MVMIIDLPVAPYAPAEEIQEWIGQLEAMREDPDAEPSDLDLIERYIIMARGWLKKAHAIRTPESGNAA